jgi:HAD superfamily hydrolase (TIGR01549 family)
MRARYAAILFDLDGTLLDLYACSRDALRGALAAFGFGGAVDNAQTWARIQAAHRAAADRYWTQKAQEGWTRAQVVTHTMRDTLAALGQGPEPAAALAERYWALFCRTDRLTPGARETLERLQARFRLGLVTNGERDSQRGRLQASGLAPLFEAVIISEEVGCAKPDPRIYALALSALGVQAADALYVGDSIGHDYAGARATGIDFCYYQPDTDGPREVRAHPELQPALRIQRLRELVGLV